jgi:uncharacterized protein (DUF1330 family)
MVAYFVVQATIKDEAQFQRYREAVVPFIASFGGRLIARGAKVEVLEGEHDTRPVVMFEFPSMEAIHAFLELARLRADQKAARWHRYLERLGVSGRVIFGAVDYAQGKLFERAPPAA